MYLYRMAGLSWNKTAGARYTKWIASLELRHKEHNNDSYPLHNNTIDFTQKNETIVHILTWYIEHTPY